MSKLTALHSNWVPLALGANLRKERIKKMKKSRIKSFSLLLDLLIDLALIVTAVFLYFYLSAPEQVAFGPARILFDLIGNPRLAVLLVAGLPFLIGVLGIFRILYRLLQGLAKSNS